MFLSCVFSDYADSQPDCRFVGLTCDYRGRRLKYDRPAACRRFLIPVFLGASETLSFVRFHRYTVWYKTFEAFEEYAI